MLLVVWGNGYINQATGGGGSSVGKVGVAAGIEKP